MGTFKAYAPVRAPITGTLSTSHVDSGASVEEGECILLMECMKMYTEVYAPIAGTVELISRIGDVVAEGTVIAKIYPVG